MQVFTKSIGLIFFMSMIVSSGFSVAYAQPEQSKNSTSLKGLVDYSQSKTTDFRLEELQRELAIRQNNYKIWTESTFDADGFVHNKCDGATFTVLNCISRGVPKASCPVYKAQDLKIPGLWYRHAKHDCFELDKEDGGSRSDNSPDIFTSLALMFWYYRDLESVNSVIAYGENHQWKMGRSHKLNDKDTVIWNDDLRALYYELRFYLSGVDHPQRQKLSRSPKIAAGWLNHLQSNQILLKYILTGNISQDEIKFLQILTKTEPHNGMYQALASRFSLSKEKGRNLVPFKSLLNEQHFPKEKLPTNHAQHCEEYLFQRSEISDGVLNPDWKPCKNEKLTTHSGTDFLWAACILLPDCLSIEKRHR